MTKNFPWICLLLFVKGFPGGARGKEPAWQCRKHKRSEFDPWVREILWRRAWQPTPVFLPGESHGQKSLAGYSPWGHKESDMTHRLTLLLSPSYRIISVSSFLFSDWRLLTWSPRNRWTSFSKLYSDVRASLEVRNLPESAGDVRCSFDPWVGKIPWNRNWHPTPLFLPGESHGQRSLVGYSPWGHKELDMTEDIPIEKVSKNKNFSKNKKSHASNLGALGRPRGIGWRGRWEGGSGWGIHVYSGLIHANVWQKPLQYCKIISFQLINKTKQNKMNEQTNKKTPSKNQFLKISAFWSLRKPNFLRPSRGEGEWLTDSQKAAQPGCNNLGSST